MKTGSEKMMLLMIAGYILSLFSLSPEGVDRKGILSPRVLIRLVREFFIF
jgi:hypothetical protein